MIKELDHSWAVVEVKMSSCQIVQQKQVVVGVDESQIEQWLEKQQEMKVLGTLSVQTLKDAPSREGVPGKAPLQLMLEVECVMVQHLTWKYMVDCLDSTAMGVK